MIVQAFLHRRNIADMLTMIILSTVMGMIIEVGVAGYGVQQSVMIRLVAMVPNLATGGWNGQFTDFIRFRIEFDFRSLKLFHGLLTSLPRSINGYLANYLHALLSFVIA